MVQQSLPNVFDLVRRNATVFALHPQRSFRLIPVTVILFVLASAASAAERGEETPSEEPSLPKRPNVLFIAMDDLNDWIGCMGGHPQTLTPNLDRLAADAMLFTNAHCPAPACNPSRSAIFSGRAPNSSGVYDNSQQMRELMPDAVLLPQYFREHGYHAAGSGKMLHYFIDARSWDDYFPAPATENPFPRTYYPDERPVSLPRGGPWQYVETDWGALDVDEEQYGGDWLVTKWVGEQLEQPPAQPFFLACGIYRPHEPWFVPASYFEPFPLDTIQLPPGYSQGDLDDVPPTGVRMARNRYFDHIREHNQWKQGIQGYLASIHFADAMLGRVLDALESSGRDKDTIVILWSDHGWQLGEKEHWQKYTPWRAVTRVPLIVCVPPSVSEALPEGTQAASTCDEPVNLLSLYPTLLELCGLPEKQGNDGPSLVPLLRSPRQRSDDEPAGSDDTWPHASITFLAQPGSYAISTRTHRYVRYAQGGEELYDIKADPFEWNNLAVLESSEQHLESLRSLAPTQFADKVAPSVESLSELAWHPASESAAPASRPDGSPFPIFVINASERSVNLFWMNRSGEPTSYGTLAAGRQKRQRTRPGAVWLIRDAQTDEPLGHFVVGDRSARATVPESSQR